jgi:hypothetical protein
MSRYKRVSKKTGNFSRRTITYNADGSKTTSYSSKSPTSGTRRTVSFNDKKKTTRTTYTTKTGGGWINRTQRTTGGRKKRTSNRRRSTGGRSNDSWFRYDGYVPTSLDFYGEWYSICMFVFKWIVVPVVILWMIL